MANIENIKTDNELHAIKIIFKELRECTILDAQDCNEIAVYIVNKLIDNKLLRKGLYNV